MFKLNTLLKLSSALILVYLIICITLYAMQKHMLFPAYSAKPVAANWQPKGKNSQQAFINGNCGKLHAAIWRTQNAKGTLMMFHGNGESLANVDDSASKFNALGYNLMAWDYPGYGRSDDCWFNQEMLLADADAAYQWLATLENPEKIYIYGYSIGAGIALSVASHHQQNPIYLVAAYDSLVNVAVDKWSNLLPIHLLFRFPMQTKQWVDIVQQKIYLIHGTQDQVIRPERAQALIKQANGKAQIEWVEHAEHADETLFAYRNNWLERLLP